MKSDSVRDSQRVSICPMSVGLSECLSLSNCSSIHWSVYLSVCPSFVHSSVNPSVHSFTCQSVYLSLSLSLDEMKTTYSIRVSVCLSVPPSAHPTVSRSVHPYVCLSVCMYVCLSICLSLRPTKITDSCIIFKSLNLH